MHYQDIWNKALGTDERVEWEFSLSARYLNFNLFFWSVIALAILFFGFYSIWLFPVGIVVFFAGFFYFGFYLRWANLFAFTNKRVLIHRGWLSTSMISIDYAQITEVEARQAFSEKIMYNSGTISINTAGSSDQEVTLTGIGDPYGLKTMLSNLMEKDRQADRFGRTPVQRG